jgi:hypothetical protein
MRTIGIGLLFILTAIRSTEAARSPVTKIIQMLSDMMAKGKQEKQDEEVRFAQFKQFCEGTVSEKTSNIAKGKEAIEQLGAAIAKAEADASVLGKETTQHEADISGWKVEIKEAAEERAKAKAEFLASHKEYTASIDSVERALHHLEKNLPGSASFAQTSSVFALLQKSSSRMPMKTRKALMSFLQLNSPDKAREALLQEAAEEGITIGDGVAPPEVATYESSSGSIVEMIEGLGEKFEDERMELEKREVNAKNAFLMMTKDLSASVMEAEMMVSTKKSTKATRLEDAAEAKGDLADTESAVTEDTKFLHDLNAECEQKSWDFTQRQEVRAGEIEAIGKAVEIMSSPEVAAGAKATSLTQRSMSWVPPAGVALAQLRSAGQSPNQEAVAQFLQQRSAQYKSRLLSLMAQRVSADPFKKVKKMIQDMIQKLMEEANEEAEHKGFCDAEMSTNKQTRDSKSEETEALKADIEGYTADISKLAEEIAELGDQITEIDAGVAKATQDREAEKAKSMATIKDAEIANTAVTQAISVLKEFYAKAATPVEQPAPIKGPIAWDPRAIQLLSPSFVQTSSAHKAKAPGAPEMEEGSYTGMGNGGVLGLMEVVQSDFEKLISETSATETEAAKIYDEFMADSDQDKAVKTADMTHKGTAKTGKESKLSTAKKDLRIVGEELSAALAYYEKLKPSCEEKVMSYEEKVAQRKAEIESLKDALEALS